MRSSSYLLPRPEGRSQNKLAFTKASVSRFHCPTGKGEAFYWDAGCTGLGIRALASGRRTWVYQYRDRHGRTRRIVLGDVAMVELDTAREAARKHAAAVTMGGNPSAERRTQRHATRLADLITEYLAHAEGEQKPRSYAATKLHLEQHARDLHNERIDAVHRADISRLLEKVAREVGKVTANRVRAALSAFFTWSIKTGRLDSDANPVKLTTRHREKSRERVLSDAEIKALWEVTEDWRKHEFDRIVRLLMVTALRRDEVGMMQWSEVGSELITIGADRMKGGIEHEVPFLPLIAGLLPPRAEGCVFGRRKSTAGTGFSGWSKAKRSLDGRMAVAMGIDAVDRWTLHDLRRTFSTRMNDAGVPPHVVEALLAHAQAGVAAVYNRAAYRQAKRDALEAWHGMLSKLIVGR